MHDFKWSPTALEFVVIFGVMPARALLYNHLACPTYSYGCSPAPPARSRRTDALPFGVPGPRGAPPSRYRDRARPAQSRYCTAPRRSASWNTIEWAPHGRFLCLAGFGSLAGQMQFWDKALGKCLRRRGRHKYQKCFRDDLA